MADVENKIALAGSITANVRRSPTFLDIYSNFIRVGISGTDFNITYSKLIDENMVTLVQDEATVRMSPQQFKALVEQATRTLAAWEKYFGRVDTYMKTPPESKIDEMVRKLREALDKAQ